MVDEIAMESEEQSHGITQVNTAVAEMDKATRIMAVSMLTEEAQKIDDGITEHKRTKRLLKCGFSLS